MNQEHLSTLINSWQQESDMLCNEFQDLLKRQKTAGFSPLLYFRQLQKIVKQLAGNMLEAYILHLRVWNDMECRNWLLRGLYPMPEKFYTTVDLKVLTSGKCYGTITKTDLDYIDRSLNEGYQSVNLEMKANLSKAILEPIIIELSKTGGSKSPVEELNRLLNDVKQINDFNFTFEFYMDIHNLCKEHQSLFWSEGHKKQITKWLHGSVVVPTRIVKVGVLEDGKPDMIDVLIFDTTWDIDIDSKPAITEKELQADAGKIKTNKPVVKIDAMTLITKKKQQEFLIIEQKLLNELPFKSAIRCAAFCEKLLDEGFFIKEKDHLIMMNNFAVNKYEINIYAALATSKKTQRKNNKENKIGDLSALQHYF